MLIEALDCAVMAFYHEYLCHEKIGFPQAAFTTSPEEFVNAALPLWLGLKFVPAAHTVIRHENVNGAFRKRWRRNNHVISTENV